MAYNYNKEGNDRDYRRIEAMYRKGCSTNDIVSNFPHLARFEVIGIIQRIFALDQIRNERRQKS